MRKIHQAELLEISVSLFWLFLENWWPYLKLPESVAQTLQT